VFLRFLCLAITSPVSFGLSKKSPSGKNLRFLVLLSKVLQNLGFGVEFEKEKYMIEMNDFIDQNKSAMHVWLTEISGAADEVRSKHYPVVDITDVVRLNCLKWLYASMYSNRQVLRREMQKKLSGTAWEECERMLEDMSILRKGGTSDSFTPTNDTLTEREDPAGGGMASGKKRVARSGKEEKEDEEDDDEDEDDDDKDDEKDDDKDETSSGAEGV